MIKLNIIGGLMSRIDYQDRKKRLSEARSFASEKVDAIKNDLESRLDKRFINSTNMGYGQIKKAARYTIKSLGHEWILREETKEPYIGRYIWFEVKALVKKSSGRWHPNPNRVWLQFRDHCSEMAASAKPTRATADS